MQADAFITNATACNITATKLMQKLTILQQQHTTMQQKVQQFILMQQKNATTYDRQNKLQHHYTRELIKLCVHNVYIMNKIAVKFRLENIMEQLEDSAIS